MPQEHERGLGGWQAEWDMLPELVCASPAAAARSTAERSSGSTSTGAHARATSRSRAGWCMAEAVAMALAPHVGKPQAHALVESAQPAARMDERRRFARCPRARIQEITSVARCAALADAARARGLSRCRGAVRRARPCGNGFEDESMTNHQTADDLPGDRLVRRRARRRARPAAARLARDDRRHLGAANPAIGRTLSSRALRHARTRPIRCDRQATTRSTTSAPTRSAMLDAAGVGASRTSCGVSLGGMTAMWLAAHAPDRVRSLVAVSTAIEDRGALDVGRAHPSGSRRRHGVDRRRVDGTLVHRRVPPCASRRPGLVPSDADWLPDGRLHRLLRGSA